MEYFPKLTESELKKFTDVYDKNYDDFYVNEWSDQDDYTDEFDMLIKSNAKFKDFVATFCSYIGDFVSSDREAAAFLKTCIDLNYYE